MEPPAIHVLHLQIDGPEMKVTCRACVLESRVVLDSSRLDDDSYILGQANQMVCEVWSLHDLDKDWT